jgi:hypothetical protein
LKPLFQEHCHTDQPNNCRQFPLWGSTIVEKVRQKRACPDLQNWCHILSKSKKLRFVTDVLGERLTCLLERHWLRSHVHHQRLDRPRALKIGMYTHERSQKKMVQSAPCHMAFKSLWTGTSRQTLVQNKWIMLMMFYISS